MLKPKAPHAPAMTTLAAVITSCAFAVGCGGGGGGGATSGSQAVTPTTPTSSTAAAPSEAASTPSSAASTTTDTSTAAAASEPTAEATAAKSGESNTPKPDGSSVAAAPKPAATVMAPKPAPAPAPVAPSISTVTASTNSPPYSTSTDSSLLQVAVAPASAAMVETAPTSAVTAAAQAAAAALQVRVDRVKTAIDSMKASQHEVKPACSPCTGWGKKPLVVMGAEPYGTAIPSNWTGTRFDQWKAILPWFVIYEGVGGNPATNTAVEINGIEIWAYSLKDKIWKKLNSGALPTWSGSYKLDAAAKSTVQGFSAVSKTVASYAPTASVIVHGGLGQVATPWNTTTDKDDVGALYVSVRHRLVLKNSSLPDDRGIANLTLNAGADYYPWLGAQLADLKATYVPGSGLGQFLKVSSQWRYSSYFVSKASVTADQILNASPPAFVY